MSAFDVQPGELTKITIPPDNTRTFNLDFSSYLAALVGAPSISTSVTSGSSGLTISNETRTATSVQFTVTTKNLQSVESLECKVTCIGTPAQRFTKSFIVNVQPE